MYKDNWNFELPEAYRRMEETLERINKSLSFDVTVWNKLAESLSNAAELPGITLAADALTSMLDNMPTMSESLFTAANLITKQLVEMPDVASILAPSLLAMAETADKLSKAYDWQLPEIDWEWMSDELSGLDVDDGEIPAELITPEIREELEESVASVVADPEQAKEIAKSKFVRWQEQHPALALLFLQLLAYIVNVLSGLTNDYLSGNLLKPANMYEEPTSTSSVVINVDVDQNVTIIDSVPYYYEVVCTDPETGEQFVGYIYKPNVAIEPTDAATATVPVESQEGITPTESIPSESVPENNE